MNPLTRRTWLILCGLLVSLSTLWFSSFELYWVDGRSMWPALAPGRPLLIFKGLWGLRLPGQTSWLWRWAGPQPGEIAVFRHPRTGHPAVKRVRWVGPLILTVRHGSLGTADEPGVPLGPAQVEAWSALGGLLQGEVFVLGDNLTDSYDSRDFGPLPVEALLGPVLF